MPILFWRPFVSSDTCHPPACRARTIDCLTGGSFVFNGSFRKLRIYIRYPPASAESARPVRQHIMHFGSAHWALSSDSLKLRSSPCPSQAAAWKCKRSFSVSVGQTTSSERLLLPSSIPRLTLQFPRLRKLRADYGNVGCARVSGIRRLTT